MLNGFDLHPKTSKCSLTTARNHRDKGVSLLEIFHDIEKVTVVAIPVLFTIHY